MSRRLSVTHSAEIERLRASQPPTKGMLAAFQFGIDLWLAANGAQVQIAKFPLDRMANADRWSSKARFEEYLHGFAAKLAACSRVTVSHSLCKLMSCTEFRVEVRGIQDPNAWLLANFNDDVTMTGIMVSVYGHLM